MNYHEFLVNLDNLEIIIELSNILYIEKLDEVIANFLMNYIPFLFASYQNLETIALLPERILTLFCNKIKEKKFLVIKFF